MDQRIVFVGNNKNGYRVLKWLLEAGESVVSVGVHSAERSRYRDKIISLCNDHIFVFDDSALETPDTIKRLSDINPDLLVSVNYGRRVPEAVLSIIRRGSLNLHPAYLPYNRGSYPNVWPIIDSTPAGVTLHLMDTGIDTGMLLVQKQVQVYPEDTGESLYARLEDEALALFIDSWHKYLRGEIVPKPQPAGGATYHRACDVDAIDEIHLEQQYLAKDLINLIRARTFPPYKGAYFREGGRRYFMEISIKPEEAGDE